jgi:hypothetical protein
MTFSLATVTANTVSLAIITANTVVFSMVVLLISLTTCSSIKLRVLPLSVRIKLRVLPYLRGVVAQLC